MFAVPGLALSLVCSIGAAFGSGAADLEGRTSEASTPKATTSDERGPRDLGALLERARSAARLPAVAAVVLEGDRIVAQGVAGVRRAGADDAARLDDRWHLGSCTKAFTATLAAILVEAGSLEWDRTLAATFPDLAAEMHADFRTVTLEDLLANRGGVGLPSQDPALWAELWKREGTPVEQRRRLTRAMLSSAPAVPPGKYLYSNGGFAIAGHMLETAAEEPWEQLLAEHVFAPLGMDSAGFGLPWSAEEGLSPHGPGGDPLDPGPRVDNPPAIGPAGTVHASITDWSAFVAEHLLGARGEAERLALEDFERLHASRSSDPRQGYALGWTVTTRPWARAEDGEGPGLCWTHSGSNNSWFATVWIAPERDVAVLCTTNIGGEGVFARFDSVVGAVIQDHLAPVRER